MKAIMSFAKQSSEIESQLLLHLQRAFKGSKLHYRLCIDSRKGSRSSRLSISPDPKSEVKLFKGIVCGAFEAYNIPVHSFLRG